MQLNVVYRSSDYCIKAKRGKEKKGKFISYSHNLIIENISQFTLNEEN